MKILITCLSFNTYTGSELYVYELARELSKEHEVHIVYRFGGELVERITSSTFVKCFSFDSPPNYFLGNGYTKYEKDGELKPTEKNIFYKISNEHQYDLILANHKMIAEPIIGLYHAPVINIIHSEIIPKFEDPIIAPNVKGYIAVRESIKNHLINKWGINKPIEVIGNPIDCDRFNTKDTLPPSICEYYLFVGSYDYLRKNAIDELINRAKDEGKEVYLCGRDYPNDFPEHVTVFPPMWNVEFLVKNAYTVASILFGRTAIEGYLCGRTVLIYDVDERGNILNISHEFKNQKTVTEWYNSETIVKEIIKYAKSVI